MLNIEPHELLALPVDELALLVLRDLVDTNEWNDYNYLNYYNAYYPRVDEQRRLPAIKAVAEALGWLRAHGMIARTPGHTEDAAIFVTRRGHQALSSSLADIRAASRLEVNLHLLIERRARRQFLLGEYENAIFTAFKAVEVRVRKLAGFGDDVYGADLMIKAFRSGGPLADPESPSGEVEGNMMFFRGAYAVLRNPSGHREVSFDDVTEASEAVMTASLLMRMLDRVEARVAAQRTP